MICVAGISENLQKLPRISRSVHVFYSDGGGDGGGEGGDGGGGHGTSL